MSIFGDNENVVGKYNKQKMIEELSEIIDGVEAKQHGHSKEDMVKSIPAKPEWKKGHQELVKMADECAQLLRKMDSRKKLFWATIENELDDYRTMTFNEETNEIEVYKDDHEHGEGKGRKIKGIVIKPN